LHPSWLLLALALTATGPLIALWLPIAYRIGGMVTIALCERRSCASLSAGRFVGPINRHLADSL
jgi:hypothetical protein